LYIFLVELTFFILICLFCERGNAVCNVMLQPGDSGGGLGMLQQLESLQHLINDNQSDSQQPLKDDDDTVSFDNRTEIKMERNSLGFKPCLFCLFIRIIYIYLQ
jgi:hypothetical protein